MRCTSITAWGLVLGALALAEVPILRAEEEIDRERSYNFVRSGDQALARGEIGLAESLYQRGSQDLPERALALARLGTLDYMRFRRWSAQERLAQAFALAPSQKEIVLSYAAVCPDAKLELALLRRYVSLAGDGDRRETLGHLDYHQKLGGRDTGILASAQRSYRLKLQAVFGRSGIPIGVTLHVNLNGSPPLKLLLDTGAKNIWLYEVAARRVALEPLAESLVAGFGGSRPQSVKTLLAATMQAGGLEYRNVIVQVSGEIAPGDFDGVIGPALFREFLVSANFSRKMLDLTPHGGSEPGESAGEQPWPTRDRVSASDERAVPLLQKGHLLLANMRPEGQPAQYFLVDTGSAFSVLDSAGSPSGTPTGSLRLFTGMTGSLTGKPLSPIRMKLGGQTLADPSPIAMDLSVLSRRNGIRISGVIGYSALSHSVVTLDYRDGFLTASSH